MNGLILFEGDPILRQELCELLDDCGYTITITATDLEAFQRLFQPQQHQLAVLDLDLPDGDSLQLIQRLRQSGHRLGILVFTARGGAAARIQGLDIGADHYLYKGCDLDELAVTLYSLQRRIAFDAEERPWTLQLGPRRLTPPNAPSVPLSQQDLRVLHCLMAQAGECVSRQQIITALGEDFLTYDQRRLDTQIRRLRRNVERGAACPCRSKPSATRVIASTPKPACSPEISHLLRFAPFACSSIMLPIDSVAVLQCCSVAVLHCCNSAAKPVNSVLYLVESI